MNLSKHQRNIILKIISEEVYDIPSYLQAFDRGHVEKYNLQEMNNSFEECEKDRKYKIFKHGHSAFSRVPMYDNLGDQTIKTYEMVPRTLGSIKDDEWEYKRAILNEDIKPKKITYKRQMFDFDFREGVYIANDFNDIKDFILLWTYLRRESLILESNKKIERKDIEVFFEGKAVVLNGGIEQDERQETAMPRSVPPIKSIVNYSLIEWTLNDEQLKLCEQFVDKQMYPTSDLKLFAMDKFRTKAEISQVRTHFVAYTAMLIALVSAIMGILSFLMPQYKEDFRRIDGQMSRIISIMDDDNSNTSYSNNTGYVGADSGLQNIFRVLRD